MTKYTPHHNIEQIKSYRSTDEFLSYKERDPCYTWLFPINLGPFDPKCIWEPTELPKLSENLTLYVHIPFCRFICSMCPFTHEPLGKTDLDSYVQAIIKEIEFYSHHPRIQQLNVTSIYFGGGTASTLTPRQIKKILETILYRYNQAENCEITLECHPRTVDREYLKAIHELGIGRVSFGIQSFNQRFLDILHLHQKVNQSLKIIEQALSLDFKTIAIDLMYRFPEQSVIDLKSEINTVLSLGIHAVSLYALDMSIRKSQGSNAIKPNVKIEQSMYYYLHDILHDAGYLQVAQPDYALPGHENQQIRDLWGAPQAENLGFGAGAFSESFNGNTWCNIHSSKEYTNNVFNGQIPILMGLKQSLDDAMSRYPVLGVRCLKVPLRPYRSIFNVNICDLFHFEIQELLRHRFVKIDNDVMIVTREGKFFIDNISKAFFNLANRGKPQLWGVNLGKLVPEKVSTFQEALSLCNS